MTRRILFCAHLGMGVAGRGLLIWTGLSLALHRSRSARRDARGGRSSARSSLRPSLGDCVLVLALSSIAAVPVAAAEERQFSEDTLSYLYGPSYRTPFVTTPEAPDGADIARHTLELKHFDSWRYGSNLVDISLRKSSDVEPAAAGGTGALEAYAIFRSGLGFNRLTGMRAVAIGPLRDIALEIGANLETKNSDYAPEERTLYVGPSLQFRLLSGFLNVGLHWRKEWNHNGVLGKSESYSPNFNIEPSWRVPFRIGSARLAFEGFADLNTPKGNDSFGQATSTEFLVRPKMTIDLGRVLGRGRQVLEAGIGVEYWHNVYGKPAGVVPGAEQLTPIFALTVRLPTGRPAE